MSAAAGFANDALARRGPVPLIDASIASVHSASILSAADDEDASPRRATGLMVVVLVHLLVGWALVSGLGGQVIEVIKKPLQATLVEEVKVPEPPPPPPPPPKEIVKAQAPSKPTPPAFVPKPEVAVATPTAPVISAVANTPPAEPPVIAPAAPPAPVVVAAAPAAPAVADIGVACPKQVQPDVPQKAVDDGVSGTVKAELRIKGGKVIDVRILSGPRIFHAAVRSAVMRYECAVSGDAEVVATQNFSFKVE